MGNKNHRENLPCFLFSMPHFSPESGFYDDAQLMGVSVVTGVNGSNGNQEFYGQESLYQQQYLMVKTFHANNVPFLFSNNSTSNVSRNFIPPLLTRLICSLLECFL